MGGGWGERGAIVCTATLALGSRQFSEHRAILTQLAAIENTASGWAGGWMMGWVDDRGEHTAVMCTTTLTGAEVQAAAEARGHFYSD